MWEKDKNCLIFYIYHQILKPAYHGLLLPIYVAVNLLTEKHLHQLSTGQWVESRTWTFSDLFFFLIQLFHAWFASPFPRLSEDKTNKKRQLQKLIIYMLYNQNLFVSRPLQKAWIPRRLLERQGSKAPTAVQGSWRGTCWNSDWEKQNNPTDQIKAVLNKPLTRPHAGPARLCPEGAAELNPQLDLAQSLPITSGGWVGMSEQIKWIVILPSDSFITPRAVFHSL